MAAFRMHLLLIALVGAVAAAPPTGAQMQMDMDGMEEQRVGVALPSEPGSGYDAAVEYERGVAALREGDYPAAERAFRHVAAAAPSYPDGYFFLGLSRAAQGELRPARRAFQDALRRDVSHLPARTELAAVLIQLGEIEEAQAQLDALKARADDCADSCAEAADLVAAVSRVEAALAAPPAD